MRNLLRFLLRLQAWLILPITFLLAAQWPLRDWLHAFSREANDAGQWLFALYVAGAITAASVRRAHITAGEAAGSTSGARWWRRIASLVGIAP